MNLRWWSLSVVFLATACGRDPSATDPWRGLRQTLAEHDQVETYRGLCDASAVAWLDSRYLAVAGDEDNVLRVYRLGMPDPVAVFPIGDFIEVDSEHPEADIESVAVLGDTVFWMTSHGRNKEGEPRPSRRRLFATTWTGEHLVPIGRPYRHLLQDLARDKRYDEFRLVDAARRAPKSPGGLNLEGLAPWFDGALLIGLRNPVPDGLALAIPLLNPDAVVHRGAAAEFGEPLRLDLGGGGVRALEPLGGHGWLIAAGSVANRVEHLFGWTGRAEDQPFDLGELDLDVEGLAYHGDEDESRLFLVSDDGTRLIGGVECKSTPDAATRSFRARRLRWP